MKGRTGCECQGRYKRPACASPLQAGTSGPNRNGTWATGSRGHAALFLGYNDGFVTSRIGVSSGGIQDFIQNGIHHLIGTPYFDTELGSPTSLYGGIWASNPYSLY